MRASARSSSSPIPAAHGRARSAASFPSSDPNRAMNNCYNDHWHGVNGRFSPVEDEEYGVDELARRAGTTVRNVRLYQERGLLPKPEKRGRTAWYGHRHLTRLQLVLRLLGRGYSLAAIKELTDAFEQQRDLGHVLGIKEALAEPYDAEPPRSLTADELADAFAGEGDPAEFLASCVEMGLVVPDGDRYTIRSPTFFRVGAELVASGISPEAVMASGAEILRSTAALADLFVTMFLDEVWRPFEEAGQPPEQVDDVLRKVHVLRPLVMEAVTSALALAMQDRTDRAFLDELE